ncbi:MAG: sulfotransferase [Gammaproteobacteria bacterium]|nr:sulfotransferase [Gammaproteobacteria bacterium]
MSVEFSRSLNAIKKQLQMGHHDQVNQSIAELRTTPDLSDEQKIELLYLNSVALRYQKQYKQAYECHTQLIQLKNSYARVYQEQGYCLLAESHTDKALEAFHKAVELNPALLASWQKIVELLNAQQHTNYHSALSQFKRLQALPPPVLAAMDLMHEGQLYKAEQVCRKFLQANKHQPDAMCLLAEIGLQLKVFDDAEFLLESCVNLYPDNEQAKVSYINILTRLGKFEQAAKHALDYLKHFSINSTASINVKMRLASCYVSLGKLEEAIEIYQQILTSSPNRAGVYVQLGHAYKTDGQAEKAIDSYQSAYQLQSNYGDAYWSLANIKTYRFSEQELTAMKISLNDALVSEQDKIHISFALGKAYEDAKDFEQSFIFYQQGNDLQKKALFYDADKTSELIDLQIKHCTKDVFEQQKGHGVESNAPIFILGLPRAGSTLLEQILASHSQVDGTMELHNILGIALKLRGRIVGGEPQYPKNLAELSEVQIRQLGEIFLRETQSYRGNAPYFIDKMPNNFVHIGLIKLILPNAKIIDARREPMACCFSGFKQLFGEGQEFSYNLTDIARYYKDYERLMAHWGEVFPGQILRVQHEDLVNNFEHEVKRILEYCGLPFEHSCLEFYNTKRNVHTPSAEQVRQPINTKGLTQWKNYEPYLDELKQTFNNV